MILRITIPILPKAQARDRITNRGGFARSYTGKAQRIEADKILTLLMAQKPVVPLVGEISISINVFMPIPKSKPRVWREKALKKEIRPVTRPDADNFGKQILDIMNKIYFEDDRQVVDLFVSKYYGDLPRWEIIFKGDY